MAIGGAFLGGGVEVVPAGSCKLELEAYTDNATVSATFTITGGGNTYTVTSGTDGRSSKVVPSGVTYTVSATVTGYTAPPSQTVIAESSSIKYVRFDAQLKKAQGDISTLQADVDKAEGDISTLKTDVGNAQGDISILQADVKRAQSTADSKADTTVATQSANGLMSSTDKTKLDGVDSALAGKVSKSGDTMTGALTLQQGGWNNLTFKHTKYDVLNPSGGDERTLNICAYDVNDKITTSLTTSNNTNYVRTYLGNYGYKTDGTRVSSVIDIYANRDGTAYALAPSWGVGTNDNSNKILTIKMANSLPSLVHTTGNETINGIKTFNSSPVVPSTPSDATGSQIATADWSLSKFQRKITYGTGDPPSGGQAGDIYIKI